MAAQDEFVPPLRKLYFTEQMVMKYEPLATALRKVNETDGRDPDAMEIYREQLEIYQKFDWCSNWDGNKYDLVFYGVSGYTGYLMMEYLKRISLKVNPEQFTFAFAGRTPAKVISLRDKLFAGTKWEDTPVLQMSYDDPVSVIDLAKSARVVVNVAGPYMLTQGELLIDACICTGAHYVDISGEIPWSLRVVDLHKHALEKGVYIIPSAASAGGFPDLGTYILAKKMREDYNEELRHCICYQSGGGSAQSASGGTLATRAAMSSAGDEVRKKMGDPFNLGGFIPDRDRNGVKFCSIEFGTGKAAPKLRAEDLDSNFAKISEDKHLGIWRGPFVYSFFDTRIVRRSNMLFADLGNQAYGNNLNFLEYSMLPVEALVAMSAPPAGATKGSAGTSVAAEAEALKAAGRYYGQGEGPSLEDLDDAWIGIFMWAQSEKGHELKCSFIGRDGYFETARVAVETAMCLAFDKEKLPFKGGVLTPTVACGTHLVQRIIATGMKFKMGDWFGPADRNPPPFP